MSVRWVRCGGFPDKHNLIKLKTKAGTGQQAPDELCNRSPGEVLFYHALQCINKNMKLYAGT